MAKNKKYPATLPRSFVGALTLGVTVLHATWGDGGLRWTLEGYSRSAKSEADTLERRANLMSEERSYSPADGMPGFAMAAEIAAELGAVWQPADVEAQDELR